MSSMLLAAAAAAVSPPPTVTAEEALANARSLYEAAPHKAAPCPEATSDEIVVCAEHEDPKKQYVPSDADSGVPDDGGVPRAPNVSGLPDCASASFCSRVGKTPRHPLIIDLKALPEPPPGSDADRIASGEKAAP
jgi:hypothetical protein